MEKIMDALVWILGATILANIVIGLIKKNWAAVVGWFVAILEWFRCFYG
jgi:hypothetical protein